MRFGANFLTGLVRLAETSDIGTLQSSALVARDTLNPDCIVLYSTTLKDTSKNSG